MTDRVASYFATVLKNHFISERKNQEITVLEDYMKEYLATTEGQKSLYSGTPYCSIPVINVLNHAMTRIILHESSKTSEVEEDTIRFLERWNRITMIDANKFPYSWGVIGIDYNHNLIITNEYGKAVVNMTLDGKNNLKSDGVEKRLYKKLE